MKLCEKCNKINVDGATNCRYCGESLEADVPYGFKVVDDLDDDLSAKPVKQAPSSGKTPISESPKVELPKPEAPKAVPVRSAPPKSELSIPASTKPTPIKPNPSKPNPPKMEPTKPISSKSDLPVTHDEDEHSRLTVRPALTGGSIKYKQRIDAYDGFESIKCPKCGSDRISLVTNTKTKGFSTGKACIGILLGCGIYSLLCGSIGANKTTTEEYWVCGGCGNHFKSNSGNAEKERIKKQAMLLSDVPDNTIDNVESIFNASTSELAKIKEASKKAFAEEYKSNGKLLTFAITSAALVIVALVFAILLYTVFDVGLGTAAISALAAVIIAVVAVIIKPKLESKYASAKYNQIQQDLREAVHINNKLKAIKAAKDNLSKLRII